MDATPHPTPVEIRAESIEFDVAGTTVRGTKYVAAVDAVPRPAVVLSHGWSMVCGGTLDDYARVFAHHGFVAIAIDFRHLGRSDGLPRQEINPWDQIEDLRQAVTFARTQPDVDGDRIGVWGTSYSGGHAIVVGAVDPRVRCVVAQVPTISGYEAASRRTTPNRASALADAFVEDREARFAGAPPATVQTVSDDPGADVAYPQRDSYEYMSAEGRRCPHWRNEVTLRSLELARQYEPGGFIHRVTPTPLLMIVADDDPLTPTDLQVDAYQQAGEPKRLITVEGGHYSVYREHFRLTADAATKWFDRHLRN